MRDIFADAMEIGILDVDDEEQDSDADMVAQDHRQATEGIRVAAPASTAPSTSNRETGTHQPVPRRQKSRRRTAIQEVSELMLEGIKDLAEKVAEQTGYEPQFCIMTALKDFQATSNSRPITQYNAELALARESMGELSKIFQ